MEGKEKGGEQEGERRCFKINKLSLMAAFCKMKLPYFLTVTVCS